MESKKAEEYIKENSFEDLEYAGSDISCGGAITAVEIAEQEMKEKAVDAFSQFVKDYCLESNKMDIYTDAEHYIKVFKELINKD